MNEDIGGTYTSSWSVAANANDHEFSDKQRCGDISRARGEHKLKSNVTVGDTLMPVVLTDAVAEKGTDTQREKATTREQLTHNGDAWASADLHRILTSRV